VKHPPDLIWCPQHAMHPQSLTTAAPPSPTLFHTS
jgi:hypothetical protein